MTIGSALKNPKSLLVNTSLDIGMKSKVDVLEELYVLQDILAMYNQPMCRDAVMNLLVNIAKEVAKIDTLRTK